MYGDYLRAPLFYYLHDVQPLPTKKNNCYGVDMTGLLETRIQDDGRLEERGGVYPFF